MKAPYYEQDGIIIYHGDCRDILPQLDAACAIVTDPPYGIKERTARATNGRGKSPTSDFRFVEPRDWPSVYGDDQPFNPSHVLTYRQVILWGANHYCHELPGSSRWLIWDKREAIASDDNADCELAWTNLKGPARIHRQLWRGICRQGCENISKGQAIVHPTQKPLALMKWCINQLDHAHVTIICDPYMGSGTTLRAAKDMGLRAIGIEIEEHYCELAAKRLNQQVFQFNQANGSNSQES